MLLKKKTKVAQLSADVEPAERKVTVHAQRKFAQGSGPCCLFSKEKDRENNFTNPVHMASASPQDIANDVILEKCPKMEDFIDFLCFQGSDLLPPSLHYFGDPHRHNFPDGLPPTPDSVAPVKLPVKPSATAAKQENGRAEAKKQPTAQQPSKGIKTAKVSGVQAKSKSTITSASKKNLLGSKKQAAVPRIHSSFRRTSVTPRIVARKGPLKQDSSIIAVLPKTSKKQIVVEPVKTAPTRRSAKKPVTRAMRRSKVASPVGSNNESSSSESSDDEEESSNSSDECDAEPPAKRKAPPPKPPARAPTRNIKPPGKSNGIPAKKFFGLSKTPAGRTTRLAAKLTAQLTPANSPARKATTQHAPKNSPALRRKPESANATIVPPAKTRRQDVDTSSPLTRVAAKKLLAAKSSPLSYLGGRRPSRRTKEAATISMTLIGQDEELDSSEAEVEVNVRKENDAESKSAPKKKVAVKARKKGISPPPSPPGTRTRRATAPTPPTATLQAKKRTMLREAAKRFSVPEIQSSTDESSDSSSSEDDNATPNTRSLRTRSIEAVHPAKTSRTSLSVAGITRLPESPSRQTRAAAAFAKKASPIKDKIDNVPASAEPKKGAPKPYTTGKKRPPPKRTAETPTLSYDLSSLIEAPVFHPSEKEFVDPIEYLEKIRGESERFGICRIVPPSSFKPDCQLSDSMRFTPYNQYIEKMFRRRGPNSRVLEAIRLHLNNLDMDCHPPPCIGGVEVDLPGLYNAVEDLGGFGEVLEKNLWSNVADTLKIPRASPDRLSNQELAKLDAIYCKYLISYATLSDDERAKLLHKVDSQKSVKSRSSNDSDDDDNECVVKGSSTSLSQFYRVARNTMSVWFSNANASGKEAVQAADPERVEATFWRLAAERKDHVCVHSANIDTGQNGYGFPCNKSSKHPWNLKVLTNNNGSLLRSLGPMPGCTVPTLNVNMLFSASCWYRDPHGLPWIDYLHTGADKIWYGVPSCQEPVLRKAMTKLVPELINTEKSVWLSSDTVMVPPTMLADEGVGLSRLVQQSGQFVVVWPQAFTSSMSTGYTVSESVYFAPLSWLSIGDSCFKELRVNSEPAVFSIQQLLWNIVHDSRSSPDLLKSVFPLLQPDLEEELQLRASLRNFGVQRWEKLTKPTDTENGKKRRPVANDDEDEECDLCRTRLFFSRVEHRAKEADDPTFWCLTHGLQKVKDRPRITQQLKILYAFDEDELTQSLQRIKDHIRTKSARKTLTHQRCST